MPASPFVRAFSQGGCRDAAWSHLAATRADDVRGSRLRNLSSPVLMDGRGRHGVDNSGSSLLEARS